MKVVQCLVLKKDAFLSRVIVGFEGSSGSV